MTGQALFERRKTTMMKYLFALMIIISAAAAFLTGKTSELTEAVLNEPVNAVELTIYLCGGMCFWGGIMRVADAAGITTSMAQLFKPILSKLFRGIDLNGKAFRAICMNIAANMLGLGNAATPLGIEAITQLKKEENCTDTASRNMIIFTVMNTASITLIPSTAASLRLKYGSEMPLDILPAVWLTSAAALAASLAAATLPSAATEDRSAKKTENEVHTEERDFQ